MIDVVDVDSRVRGIGNFNSVDIRLDIVDVERVDPTNTDRREVVVFPLVPSDAPRDQATEDLVDPREVLASDIIGRDDTYRRRQIRDQSGRDRSGHDDSRELAGELFDSKVDSLLAAVGD